MEVDSEPDDGSLYAACLLSNLGSSGPHLPRNEKELIPLKSLENDVQDHFLSLGIKTIQQSCLIMTLQQRRIWYVKGLTYQRKFLMMN